MRGNSSKRVLFEISTNIWYHITFVFWFGSEMLFRSTLEYIGRTPVSVVEDHVTLAVTIMLIIQIFFFQSYSRTDIVLISVISIIILIATYRSGYQYLASAWIFVIASKRCEIKQTTKIAFWVLTVGILTVLFMNKIGIITDFVIYRNGEARHSFGFSHPNQLGVRIFQWILCFSYAYWDSFGVIHFAITCIVAYWMHSVTDSQTATICTLFYIILMIIIKYVEGYKSKFMVYISGLLRIGSVIIGILSILLTIINVRSFQILKQFDKAISSRFYWTHKIYKYTGASLFGKKFSTQAVMNGIMQIRRGMYLDNGYANLWLRFGSIVLVLFLVGYYLAMKKNGHNQLMTVILFVFSVYGIMEVGFVQLTHNIFLLVLASVIYEDKDYCSEKKGEEKRIVINY